MMNKIENNLARNKEINSEQKELNEIIEEKENNIDEKRDDNFLGNENIIKNGESNKQDNNLIPNNKNKNEKEEINELYSDINSIKIKTKEITNLIEKLENLKDGKNLIKNEKSDKKIKTEKCIKENGAKNENNDKKENGKNTTKNEKVEINNENYYKEQILNKEINENYNNTADDLKQIEEIKKEKQKETISSNNQNEIININNDLNKEKK